VIDTNDYLISSGDNLGYTPEAGTGTYMGGGQVTLLPKLSVKTKDFNPYQAKGKQLFLSYVDLQADSTENSAVTINVLENQQIVVNDNVNFSVNNISTATTIYGSITGATQANPCIITSSNHSLKTGDQVSIKNVNGMTNLNNNTYTVTFLTLNTFSLNTDSTAFTAYINGGTWVKVSSIFNLTQFTIIGPNTAVINATAIVVTIAKVSIIFSESLNTQ